MKFEIINPHDKAYLEADSPETATVATLLFSEGWYGLKEVDGNFELPVLAFMEKGWLKTHLGKTGQELWEDADVGQVKKALLSVHLAGERTSMDDIVKVAHGVAESLRKAGNNGTESENTESESQRCGSRGEVTG